MAKRRAEEAPDLFAAAPDPGPATPASNPAPDLPYLIRVEALCRKLFGPGSLADFSRTKAELEVTLGLITQQEADERKAWAEQQLRQQYRHG